MRLDSWGLPVALQEQKHRTAWLGVTALPFILKWGVMGGRGAEKRFALHRESSPLENG